VPLIGAHISVAGGLYRAFERADSLECESMQIFTRNQRQWRAKEITIEESEAFYRASNESGVKRVVSHASYLINLAGSPDVRTRSEEALVSEIERCYQLSIDDVVLHPGFAGDDSEDEAIKKISDSLRKVIEKTEGMRVRILLETMAGQGSVIGGDLTHFTRILDRLKWNERIGICADMCHLFAAGYEIRTHESYNRLISILDKHVTLERVCCWHLSDSKVEKGALRDRHAHLGQGEIGLSPFAMLMGDERFKSIPAVLETPKDGEGDAGNLAILRKLRGA
jgi:deoxyribonuclease-4